MYNFCVQVDGDVSQVWGDAGTHLFEMTGHEFPKHKAEQEEICELPMKKFWTSRLLNDDGKETRKLETADKREESKKDDSH